MAAAFLGFVGELEKLITTFKDSITNQSNTGGTQVPPPVVEPAPAVMVDVTTLVDAINAEYNVRHDSLKAYHSLNDIINKLLADNIKLQVKQ